MLHSISIKLSKIICKNTQSEKNEICTFGLEIIVSTVINIGICIIIAIKFNRPFECLLYLCAFCVLRMYVGGYHANSHFTCGFIFFLCFLGYMLGLEYKGINTLIWSSSYLAAYILFGSTPTVPTGHILNKAQVIIMKRKSQTIISIILIVNILSILLFDLRYFSLACSYALVYVTAFKILGNKKYEEDLSNEF